MNRTTKVNHIMKLTALVVCLLLFTNLAQSTINAMPPLYTRVNITTACPITLSHTTCSIAMEDSRTIGLPCSIAMSKEGIVKLESEEYIMPNGCIKDCGTYVYHFRGLKSGTVTITLIPDLTDIPSSKGMDFYAKITLTVDQYGAIIGCSF